MSNTLIQLKRNDTLPAVELPVVDSSGVAVNLAGGTVTFSMGVATPLPLAQTGTDPLTIIFVDKSWVARLRVGDILRIEYAGSDELLDVTVVDHATGSVTFGRAAEGTTESAYYPKGSLVYFYPVRSQAASVSGSSSNILTYSWIVGDTVFAGSYIGEFEYTDPASKRQTYPSALSTSGYLTIQIVADVDGD